MNEVEKSNEVLSTNSSEDAANPAAEEGEEKPLSRREQLRAKLRGAEKRLLSYTSSASSDGGSGFLGQMASVQADLKKVAEEKSMLQVELDKLKNATDDDDFLKEKMAGIQDGFAKQVETIQRLQDEVFSKDDEIEHLHTELIRKIRRVVELEFDLETHEVHYTSYAAEQFKLGEQALAEIKSGKQLDKQDSDDLSMPTVEDIHASKDKDVSPRKAQKLISKLLADLDDLEARYKADKIESADKLYKIELSNEQLQTKLQMIEQETQNAQNVQVDDTEHTERSTASGAQPSVSNDQFLRKRIQTLQAKRDLSSKEIERLRNQLHNVKKMAEAEARDSETNAEHLRMDNDALRARIAELETSSPKKGGLLKRKKEKNNNPSVYEETENRIAGAFEKIVRLEAERDIKDRQIGTLKNEVASLRMKEVANGKTEGTGFTKSDTDILRSPTGRSRAIADDRGDGSDNSLVSELQDQLQEAQQLLVKKDQELVIERAKAASTAAGLLARITELTGSKFDSKSGNGKQRFYM